MGALLEQTHAFPFIPHIDRKHILKTEPQYVLIAVHIPRLFGFISHIQRLRMNPFLRLRQLLIDGGATPAGVNGDT